MLLSKCSACNSKKSKFLKEQESKGFLGNYSKQKYQSQVIFH